MVQKKEGRKIGRPRKFDENEALDKAMEVFWELGYDATDTETLSRRMGLSKPSLYNAFGAKEDLFIKALARYHQTRSKLSMEKLTSAHTPKQGLSEYFNALAENVAGDEHPKGCLISSIAVPLKDRMPRVAEFLEDLPKESHAQLSSWFEEQIHEGHLPSDFDIREALSIMKDLGAGMILQGRQGANLEALQAKTERNVKLVLIAGERL